MRVIKTKTVKENKKYYNYYLVVEVNGEEKWICIKNAFKNDWPLLDMISKYYDKNKDE